MRLYFVQFPDGTLKTHAKGSAVAYNSIGGAKTALAYAKRYYRGIEGIVECKLMYADIELKEYSE